MQSGTQSPNTPQPVAVRALAPQELETRLPELAEILHATVHAGAAVSFILPHGLEDSRRFWQQQVLPQLRSGGRILLGALVGDRLAGTVQLLTAMPENQAHRCEVAKLMVHPEFRKLGLGRALMDTLEQQARTMGKSLITLDTRTGDAAEPLYRSLGYQTAGVIPNFARDPDRDRLHGTTYMYKIL